jgi:hypothetical protein
MNTQVNLEKCLSFINCHLKPPDRVARYQPERAQRRAVTISRQAGCGAHELAERLAAFLDAHAPRDTAPWTVFDRNLVEQVLEDHHLPERLARFMPEDRISELDDIMEEVFGLHPPSWTLVHQTAETILRLAELGNVILLGRGANVITAKLPGVFHVRLVASLEQRLERTQHAERMNRKEALRRIQQQDRGRNRYVKKYFGKNADDPLLYHMIINTDLIPLDTAARMLGNAILEMDNRR